ncbi:uncharacterized protein TNCV_4568731 [Trichonephila clavipes]|nr:uncharacterized protein TNCV_4568731 [Trichonephila clavipes]
MAFLDMTKSSGPEGVFGRMLENLAHRGKLRLLDIINLSWKLGRLPNEWKRATIIPIKKAAGIEKQPSVETRVGLFADDIAIWCSGRDLVEMERILNNALSSISDYALEFKLCFNPTKSIATFFTTNKRLYSYQPNLKMDNKNLAYEKHPKYLGYVLDPEWSSHKPIDHIVSKCRKRLSILKFIADKDWGAEAVTLRDTYLALIRPILEYGFPVLCVRRQS